MIIKDITKIHAGKWFEVLGYCKENDSTERGEVLAKFLNKMDAIRYANNFECFTAGYYMLIVR